MTPNSLRWLQAAAGTLVGLALAGAVPVAAASHAGSPPGQSRSSTSPANSGHQPAGNNTPTAPAGNNTPAAPAGSNKPAAPAGSNKPAAPAGNNNRGDAWLDNVGQPSGPGHEMDPHLACADINLWGAGMADPSGTFTIDGWPPSGSQEQDYPAAGTASWTYNPAAGGSQIMAVIPVKTLIDNAIANGDVAQSQQGFHFKLQLSQDPQKHKVFWVNCPAPAKPVTPPTTTVTPVTPGTPVAGTTTPSGGVQGQSVAPVSGGVQGLSVGPASGANGTSAASATPATGVAGAAVGVPGTGVRLPILPAIVLILTGTLLTLLSRRLRRAA